MIQPHGQPPSITTVRRRVTQLLRKEREATRRTVVVLALDGIPDALARDYWEHASIATLSSVFPTTSATAWLSSTTGLDTSQHGIPGVVFKLNSALINIYQYQGDLGVSAGNLFSDAAQLGFTPLSIVGDLDNLACSWKDLLLDHTKKIHGHRFYNDDAPLMEAMEEQQVLRRIKDAIQQALSHQHAPCPLLIWCFVDIDLYIHRFGYNAHVLTLLALIDQLAVELVNQGLCVVAWSDHGLTPTGHNQDLQQIIHGIRDRYDCPTGGAGRTLWYYTDTGMEDRIIDELRQSLPADVSVKRSADVFAGFDHIRDRVGNICLIANGAEFIAPCGYRYEHGSLTPAELSVPFAVWG